LTDESKNMTRVKRGSQLLICVILVAIAGWYQLLKPNKVEPGESDYSTLGLLASPASITVEQTGRGGPAQAEFTLKNSGKRSIRIVSVDTSCGCSVAQPLETQSMTPRAAQSLVILGEAPTFGTRNVSIDIKATDSLDPSQEQTVQLQMKLIGKSLSASRVFDLPTMIELYTDSPKRMIRRFEIRTIEESEARTWIKSVTCDLPQINAKIVSIDSSPRPNNAVQRTYTCEVSYAGPSDPIEIAAGTIHLINDANLMVESASVRIIVRHRIPWQAFPAVLKLNATEGESCLVTLQANDEAAIESLRRIEIATVPDGVKLDWLPSDETQIRRLLVTIPAGLTFEQPLIIRLIDPESLNQIGIPLIRREV
jgi:hypothetical protein